MKRKIAMLMIIAVAVIALGFYGGHEYFRSNPDTADLKESFHVNAINLLNEFLINDSTAINKYIGKIIQVEGRISNLEKDDKGYFTLVLGDDGIMSSVRCSMDLRHNQEAAILKKGRFISVKGELTGYNKDATDLLGSDIQMSRCIINNNE